MKIARYIFIICTSYSAIRLSALYLIGGKVGLVIALCAALAAILMLFLGGQYLLEKEAHV